MVHVLLKTGFYFASVWDECNCVVVWMFFGIDFLWGWNENWPFPVLWSLLSYDYHTCDKIAQKDEEPGSSVTVLSHQTNLNTATPRYFVKNVNYYPCCSIHLWSDNHSSEYFIQCNKMRQELSKWQLDWFWHFNMRNHLLSNQGHSKKYRWYVMLSNEQLETFFKKHSSQCLIAILFVFWVPSMTGKSLGDTC